MPDIHSLKEILSSIVQSSGFMLDNRTVISRLKYIESYTRNIPYLSNDNVIDSSINSWADFIFMDGKTPENLAAIYNSTLSAEGMLLPHQGFLLAMLKMLETPQAFMNYFPDAHKDLYYRQLLGLQERPAKPSQVALNFVLDSSTPELMLTAGTLIDGGQDKQGTRIELSVDNDLLVNHSTLSDLRWCCPKGDSTPATSAIIYGDQHPWPVNGVHLFSTNIHDQAILSGKMIASSKLVNDKYEDLIILVEFESSPPLELFAHISSGNKWLPMDISIKGVNTLQITLPADYGEVSAPENLFEARFDVPVMCLLVEDGQHVPHICNFIVRNSILHDTDFKQTIITPFGHANEAQPVDDLQIYIGVRDIEPGQTLTLFWNLNNRGHPLKIKWEYLAKENRWLDLEGQLIDGTISLMKSGIWAVIVPEDASKMESSMPTHRHWFRGLIKPVKNEDATSSIYPCIISVLSNCMTATLNNFKEVDDPLLSNSFDEDKVLHPFDDIPGLDRIYNRWKPWGGRRIEERDVFIKNVAIRLSHRNRALTWSDMALILKSQFDEVLEVIIPYNTTSNAITAQLQQKLIVLPRENEKDNDDSLRPLFNAARLDAMSKFLQSRASLWQNIQVMNPSYRDVSLEYKVKFRTGVNITWAEQELRKSIVSRYIPWFGEYELNLSTLNVIDYYDLMGFLQQSPNVDYVSSLMLNGKEESVIGGSNEVLILCW